MGSVTAEGALTGEPVWQIHLKGQLWKLSPVDLEPVLPNGIVIRNTFVHVLDATRYSPRRRASSVPPDFRTKCTNNDHGDLGYKIELPTMSEWTPGSDQDVKGLPPDVPTVGSIGHATEDCKPCFYIHARVSCQFGHSCQFCHLYHPKRPKMQTERPTKTKRKKISELAYKIFESWQPSMSLLSHDSDDGALANIMIEECEQVQRLDGATRKYISAVLRALAKSVRADTAPLDSDETYVSPCSPPTSYCR